MAGVRQLLEESRLGAYAAAFEEMGYDDVGFLMRLANDSARPERLQMMNEHVGFKPGHAMRFLDTVGKHLAKFR